MSDLGFRMMLRAMAVIAFEMAIHGFLLSAGLIQPIDKSQYLGPSGAFIISLISAGFGAAAWTLSNDFQPSGTNSRTERK